MFGRATIGLGIGPHSSFHLFNWQRLVLMYGINTELIFCHLYLRSKRSERSILTKARKLKRFKIGLIPFSISTRSRF